MTAWLAVIAVLTFCLLWFYKRIGLRFGFLDYPSARGQHHRPVVVGAGIMIAFTVIAAIGLADSIDKSLMNNPLIFLAMAGCFTLTGFFDDLYRLSPRIRLVIYGVGSALFLADQPMPFENELLAALMLPVLWITLVWAINLYNFMDGIDGFATVQALAVLLSMAWLASLSPAPAHKLIGLLLVPCAALVPFLIFNWAPAAMFLGDAGSVFLGFYLFAMGLTAALVQPLLAVAWLILMMPFLIDATLTLLLRLGAGHSPHIAHRDHCYQRLARMTGSASTCALGLVCLQVFWQVPLAWWATVGDSPASLVVIFSAIPGLKK